MFEHSGGAGHGGKGGNAMPEKRGAGIAYDMAKGHWPGSGAAENGGRGGGIVVMHAVDVLLEGVVASMGGNATEGTSQGGGAGGSVNLHVHTLRGMGLLDVRGGAGGSAVNQSGYAT